MTLPEPHLKRLVQILGLLGSNADGEVLAAARKAQQILTDAKLGWPDVISGAKAGHFAIEKKWTDADVQAAIKLAYSQGYAAGSSDAKVAPARPLESRSFPEFARIMLEQFDHLLSEWEAEFCESWIDKRYYPSPKQLAVFQKLAERTGVAMP